MVLTPEILEEKHPQADWTHIYIDGSTEVAVRNGSSGVIFSNKANSWLLERYWQKMLKFQTETSALQNGVAYIAEMKSQKTVILTDSKAVLQSLTFNTPRPADPPAADRPAASPPGMHCGPTVDPGPLRDSRK